MCGRFANALPPGTFRNNILRRLAEPRHGERGRRASREDDAGESGDRRSGAGASDEQEQQQMQNQDQEQEQEDTDAPLEEGKENNIKEAPGFEQYYPTHNVAPGSRMPVVRLGDKDNNGNSKTVLIQSMRWGLLPRAAKVIPKSFEALRTINARDDSVLSGRSMWTPILRSAQRCVVFVQGFYEWEKRGVDDNIKIPHFVGMKDPGQGRRDAQGQPRALMPMAGLWERCRLEGEEEDTYSYTIITTESNKQLNFLHDRMPVILPNVEAIRIWLGLTEASSDVICRLLKPYDAGDLDVYPVPKEVGKVGNDDASFILPVSKRKDGIAAAFGRVTGKRERQASNDADKANDKPKEQVDANSETNAPVPLPSSREDGLTTNKVQEGGKRESDLKREPGEEDERETKRQRVPSSKWSPEPFNPPDSPPRPNGGYSTNTQSATTTPSKRSGGSASLKKSPAQSKGLQEAAKGTKDIRSFFSK